VRNWAARARLSTFELMTGFISANETNVNYIRNPAHRRGKVKVS
jgi:hypothetical protein